MCNKYSKQKANLAFTLLEVILVVALVALLGAIAAGSMKSWLRNSASNAALVDLQRIHLWSQQHSRGQSVSMKVDLARRTISARQTATPFRQFQITWPLSFKVNRLLKNNSSENASSDAIEYIDGHSTSYAYQTSSGTLGNWVVICGPTGSVEILDGNARTDEELQAWFAVSNNPD